MSRKLDALDRAILGSIRIGITKTEKVARSLNADRAIVKGRIGRLKAEGYVKGFWSLTLTDTGFKEAEPPKIPTVMKSGGSTGGGFLIGIGFMILLIGFGATLFVEQHYRPMYHEAMGWKEEVQTLYAMTNSPAYESTLTLLEGMAPYASRIAEALRLLGLGEVAGLIGWVPEGADVMREVRSASRRAYVYFELLEEYPPDRLLQYSQLSVIGGVALMTIGTILRVRAPKLAFVKSEL